LLRSYIVIALLFSGDFGTLTLYRRSSYGSVDPAATGFVGIPGSDNF
jgi:hypothetical protein